MPSLCFRFTPLTQKLENGHFSADMTQIFISRLTFETDPKNVLKNYHCISLLPL